MVAQLRTADFTADHRGARVVLTGTADAQVSGTLESWLLAVVAEGPYAPELVVDLVGLEFMTGGCVKAFVSLLDAFGDGAGAGTRLRFVSNRAHGWQRRSLAALACMAADLIVIDVQNPPSGIA